MKDYKSLSPTRWDCKYRIVFIPKKRKKVLYGSLRKYMGDILHELAKQKGIEILAGESLFLRKLVLGLPAQASSKNHATAHACGAPAVLRPSP